MTEESKNRTNDGSEPTEEDGKGKREAIEDRLKQGLGMLGAMRDAIEDTIREAKDRGDLSPDRAKEVMRSALNKAQEKAGEAKEALDLVKQKEFDTLKERVEELRGRMTRVEDHVGVNREERPEAEE
jgi:polyhydroxyalkanoate synthesis regulator phasin